MRGEAGSTSDGVATVLGAGYAGIAVAREIRNKGRRRIPVNLVDRHPVHVLRTQLYEVGKIAGSAGDSRYWTLPLEKVVDSKVVKYVGGEVQKIDLDARTVTLDSGVVRYRVLAICLGSVPAYYGVPGAAQHTHSVYRLGGAQKLAAALRDLAARSMKTPNSPRVVIVGGGSTGTELAAEIATTDWGLVTQRPARRLEVLMVCGALPFLTGLPEGLVRHARQILDRAGVKMEEGRNVREVAPDRVILQDGTEIPFDLCVWCAGVQAPPMVAQLPATHGKSGRLTVDEHLELPDRPGVFAVGDVAEFHDPKTGMVVPATAQAAIAEAPVAGYNMVARWFDRPLKRFVYREKGVIVSLGLGQAAASLRRMTVWGSPPALLKSIVQREYVAATETKRRAPGL